MFDVFHVVEKSDFISWLAFLALTFSKNNTFLSILSNIAFWQTVCSNAVSA